MMIDWVSFRAREDAAAHSFHAVRAIPSPGILLG
jgi:hypothetical protein